MDEVDIQDPWDKRESRAGIDKLSSRSNDPTRFCLGIECDGATYHSGRSVRERDIARQAFLESRGWTIHRIWSRDFWQSPQREIDAVLARLPNIGTRKTA